MHSSSGCSYKAAKPLSRLINPSLHKLSPYRASTKLLFFPPKPNPHKRLKKFGSRIIERIGNGGCLVDMKPRQVLKPPRMTIFSRWWSVCHADGVVHTTCPLPWPQNVPKGKNVRELSVTSSEQQYLRIRVFAVASSARTLTDIGTARRPS